jgi:hypothetical protein
MSKEFDAIFDWEPGEAPIIKGVDYAKFVGKPSDFTITQEGTDPRPPAGTPVIVVPPEED